jgi:outer membrane protein assembly factor BamB
MIAGILALTVPQVASASPADQSVAYQLNPAHDGHASDAGLATPLAQQWSVTLPGAISYPVIVNGVVYVTASDKTLYALNQATGNTIWSHSVGGQYPRSGLAFNRGEVFALNSSGLLTAFDPMTGAIDWSKQLPGQFFFSSAPTAAGGIVYAGGAGGGGTLYAVRESDGRLLWSQAVENGDQSSPAVDAQAVYVTYACQQDYGFARDTGTLLWHHNGPCEGGGGKTPVVASGALFSRDNGDDLILEASTGSVLGAFNAGPAPAVANNVAFMLSGSTLNAIAGSGQGTTVWQVSGDGQLDTAPLVVGSLVFVGSASGELYALDVNAGTTSWSTNVGSTIPAPDEQNVSQPLTGLGAANGTLVVPVGNTLIAYRTAGAITAAPTNQSLPTIDGKPQAGQKVAADVGIWSGLPSSYTYQWELCDVAGASCGDIDAAHGSSFEPTAGDVGSTLRVKVIASNTHGSSTPVVSGASAAVLVAAPINETAPSIGGVPQHDEILTANPGTWSGSPTSYDYQWRRCSSGQLLSCSDIMGATSSSYTAVAADVGHQLVVRVVATNTGGDSDPADSAPTDQITPSPPVNESPPTVSGFPQEGETLTADPGTWSNEPTAYAYQWFTCNPAGTSCPDISGATDQTYVVGPADVGQFIGVEVIATNAGGDSEPADSDAIGPVLPAAPVNQTPPRLSGTAQQGQTLTVDPGTWTGSPSSFTYYWYSCNNSLEICIEIPGASGKSYGVGPGDIGRRLVAGVIATNTGGDSDEEFSNPTDPVLPAPPANQVPPAISGQPQRAQTLTVAPGTWTNTPTGYAYQWMRCGPAGTDCTSIAGATSATYLVTGADVGDHLVVQVVALNAGGRSSPASSSPTDVVLPAQDATFAKLKTVVAPSGTLRVYLTAKNPGEYKGTATTRASSLAPRTAKRKPRGTAVYGSGSATATKPGTTVLVIKPSARARRAIASGRRILVRVKVTFRSALGGKPSTRTYSLTVRGRRSP